MHRQWIKQIENLCASAGIPHIDIVVDHAGWGLSVLPALEVIRPHMPWYSLFTDTPEQNLLAHAPILMRLTLDQPGHNAWLDELLQTLGTTPRLLFLISPLPFAALANTLRGLTRLQWGKRKGVLRYFDPRVFPVLLHAVLTADQAERFLQLGVFWGWLDRDHCLMWEAGTCSPDQVPEGDISPVVLNDEQFHRLGTVGDAHQLMELAKKALPDWSAEQRFTRCRELVLQANQENYFGCLKQYVANGDKWRIEASVKPETKRMEEPSTCPKPKT